MNLNEQCLLKFLTNPDELMTLSEFIVKNLCNVENTSSKINN